MPGLIESLEYAAAKKALCAPGSCPGAEEAIDAVEWRLVVATHVDVFQTSRSNSPVRYISVEATPHTPAIVVVFAGEHHGGVEKCLLLDVFQAVEDADV